MSRISPCPREYFITKSTSTVSDQKVGATQVFDLRLTRAKDCEITAKDGAKWGVERKSPEPLGPSPYRVSQEPPGDTKRKKE